MAALELGLGVRRHAVHRIGDRDPGIQIDDGQGATIAAPVEGARVRGERRAVLALEWAEYNIRANCIAPGTIDTRLFGAIFDTLPEEEGKKQRDRVTRSVPMKRVGEPREIADACLFLASEASSYMTGQTFSVDGGVLLV